MATDFGKIDHVDTLDTDAGIASLLDSEHFLAGISHELRTPLNAIIGYTGTLLMQLPGPLNDEQEKQLRTVQSSARQLLALINDLLDLAKLGAGQLELQRQPLNCRGIVEELLRVFRPQARKKGLVLQFHAPPQALVLRSDRRLVQQILVQLVNHAIRSTQRGQVGIRLERGEAAGRPVVRFCVSDSGGGALQDSLQQVGIQLSHKLAGLLDGSIRYFDKAGDGGIFVLTLPQE